MHEAEYDTVKVCINVFCMDVVRNDGYPSGLSEYQPAFPLYQIRPQVFEYSIPDKQYTEWSRTIQKQGFHHLWLQRDTPITHISFHLKRPMHILLHDAYMFCIIDKSLVSSSLLPPVLSLILPYLESSSSKVQKVRGRRIRIKFPGIFFGGEVLCFATFLIFIPMLLRLPAWFLLI